MFHEKRSLYGYGLPWLGSLDEKTLLFIQAKDKGVEIKPFPPTVPLSPVMSWMLPVSSHQELGFKMKIWKLENSK